MATQSNEKDAKYYIGFRQIHPSSGQWVVHGPFDTYERANQEREILTAGDSEVSAPFAAYSKEQAEERIKSY